MLKPGARTAKFKLGEAVMINWDTNLDQNERSSTSAQRLQRKNGNQEGKIVMDVGDLT